MLRAAESSSLCEIEMPPKKTTPIKEQAGSPANAAVKKSTDTAKIVKTDDKMQAAMDRFAAELANDSDEESANASDQQRPHIGDEAFNANGTATELSEAEKEIIREELKKVTLI
ncbi:hypothetical protein Tcan_12719 [Toxocara canis]|uniref:Uncharacterized protein n=1 Tax=Toxocara canis TaxID=6265 RepID=A0A0B2W1C8_TOXCA|nr:hypothetical protein Tcan_12719 [Toxocara canis]